MEFIGHINLCAIRWDLFKERIYAGIIPLSLFLLFIYSYALKHMVDCKALKVFAGDM